MSYQKWFAIGNLTQDPELKYTQNGTAKCRFSIAINRRVKDRDDEVLFVDIECWDKTAENAAEYLRKGRKVFVEGEWRKDQWTTDEGVKKTRWYVNAYLVQFMDRPKDDDDQRRSRRDDDDERPARRAAPKPKEDFDDLPF